MIMVYFQELSWVDSSAADHTQMNHCLISLIVVEDNRFHKRGCLLDKLIIMTGILHISRSFPSSRTLPHSQKEHIFPLYRTQSVCVWTAAGGNRMLDQNSWLVSRLSAATTAAQNRRDKHHVKKLKTSSIKSTENTNFRWEKKIYLKGKQPKGRLNIGLVLSMYSWGTKSSICNICIKQTY